VRCLEAKAYIVQPHKTDLNKQQN